MPQITKVKYTCENAVVRWIDEGKVEQVAGRGAINANEIDAVVQEIRRIVLEQNYTGSVGVVIFSENKQKESTRQ